MIKIARVLRNRTPIPAALFAVILTILSFHVGASSARAAVAFDSAEVSKVQNQVKVGSRETGSRRPAEVSDVVRENNFVLTEDKSRAELTFPDKSLVRVGQNSVFTFDGARTLELKKGAMLFYVPPGAGGGTIKTPAVTAAITGTIGFVTENLIAITKGSLTLPDGTVVREGSAVEFFPGGGYRVFEFEPESLVGGELVQMGPLPESPFAIDSWLGPNTVDELLRVIERSRIIQADPRVQQDRDDDEEEQEEEEEEPDADPLPPPVGL